MQNSENRIYVPDTESPYVVELHYDEIWTIRGLVERAYSSYGFEEALENMDEAMMEIQNDYASQSNATKIFVSFKEKPAFPLAKDANPTGFMIVNFYRRFQRVVAHVVNCYVEPNQPKVFRKFIDNLCFYGKNYRVNLCKVDAPGIKQLRHWEKMGFEIDQYSLTFKGDAEAFWKHNRNNRYFTGGGEW